MFAASFCTIFFEFYTVEWISIVIYFQRFDLTALFMLLIDPPSLPSVQKHTKDLIEILLLTSYKT